MSKQNKAYILPHTHWDREWRYPIWKSRALLIQFMDQLLDILERDTEYRCFLLDGQVAPILDYLEVAPEKRDRVCGYIKDGRIAVGPWFTLPDLYPLDGECLVRNLLRGTREARALGGCLDVGYNSFGWGQTAQFPQIYAGFGIDFIVCAKKVSNERAPQSEFIWQSPDGTKVLTTRLGEHARGNFYFNTYLYAKYGVNCFSSEFRFSNERSGAALHDASSGAMDEDLFMVRPRLGYDKERLIESYEAAKEATKDTALPSHRLFLNGTDFSTPQPQLTEMRRDLENAFPDTEFLHARLEEYAKALHNGLNTSALRVIDGELRDGPAGDCSGNALSSRIYLKIANKRAQNSLIRRAEPLASAMWAVGEGYPVGMLKKAWDYMLKAHPHDSINGVTQDKTANDVEYRLAQAIEIADVVSGEAIASLAKRLDLSSFSNNAILMLLHNPNPYPVREIMKLNVLTSASDGIWSLSATDEGGNGIRVQEIARDEKAYPVHDAEARPWPYKARRHLLYLDAGELPSMGYKLIEFKPDQRFEDERFYWLPMRRAIPDDILAGEHTLENEHLLVQFNANGSLRLTHKASGRVYDDLHYLEDSGDVGNYWAYYPPYHNQVHTTLSGNARIWSEDHGALSATIAVEYTLKLPVAAEESVYGVRGKGERSAETGLLVVTSRFTLSKGSRRLEVQTTVDNMIRNHRLRVAFPTGIQTDYADAAGHFTVDRRPKVNQQADDGSYWPEMQTLPMQSFVDVNDGEHGMALLNNCLTEYELKDDQAGTLYLTLFRAMGNMIVTWWEAVGQFANQEGSQMLRKQEFNYAIYPHEGDWQQGEIYREAQKFNAEPKGWQLCGGGSGDLPTSASFCHIDNAQIVLSSLKRTEDRDTLLMRVFNPTEKAQKTRIELGFAPKAAWLCRLDETRESELPIEGKGFALDIPAGKIMSMELERREEDS